MKGLLSFSLILLSIGVLFAQDVRARDYTRWGLPDGAIARLGKGSISNFDRAVAWSPDGTRLAVAGSIGIWLYDAHTGAEVARLTGHRDWVSSVAFSPDGNTLASGSRDDTIRLWDVQTGEERSTIRGHTENVLSVAFSPDGNTLASGSRDATIRLWDVQTGEERSTIRGHTENVLSVAFSPDGNTLASGSAGGTIRLWDVQTGEERSTLTGHRGVVHSLAFSPDGNTLASGSGDGTILLWDTSTLTGPDGTTDEEKPVEIGGHRPDELVGTWEAVISGDDADTTKILEFHADSRFVISEKTTSHASFKQTLIAGLGADPGRIQFVADSLAARESRFHGALVADKQVFATETKGVWGVEGNVILALADSFSMSLNGLQGNDVFEFYEEIVPLVVPSENAGLVQLFLLGIALIQETFNAIIEAREVFPIGLYSFENDNLVLVLDEDPVHYSRVSETPTPDFDGDGTVGFSDFVQFAARFGLSQSDAGYDARFDLDGDGAVGFSDFLIFAASFGQGA